MADVSSEAQVLDLYRDLAERWGRLDALVNNAGVAGPTSRLEDTTLDAWRQTLDVNLTGTFLCARGAVPLLRGRRRRHHQYLVGGGPASRCARRTAPASSGWPA